MEKQIEAKIKTENITTEEVGLMKDIGTLQANMELCKTLVPTMVAVVDSLEASVYKKEATNLLYY